MNILYLDWPCFGGEDLLFAFKMRGYNIAKFSHEDYSDRVSDSFIKEASAIIDNNDFDYAFSFNYFPLLARVCDEKGLKYISIVYDSPQVKLYSYTVTFPTNYIFHFDSAEVSHFRSSGINTFYYMPLPVNSDKIKLFMKQEHDLSISKSDVSFVGALYNEEHNFYERLGGVSDYTLGFLEGLMNSQSLVYGYNFLEEALPDEVIDDIQKIIKYHPNVDGVETVSYIISEYILARKLTSTERLKLLSSIGNNLGDQIDFKLYTRDKNFKLPGAKNLGPADYYMDLPYIFHDSKINLNISLRSIKSGIPLRCMDIMAAQGFLLTNFQHDMLNHFEPGVDFAYFESEADLLEKIEYYLNHEDERMTIAENGYKKIAQNHNYDAVLDAIFEIVNSN